MTNALPRGPELLPISVITGFLGSGKTTLLRHLLKHPDTGRVALIINEFGEIGIDHDLIRTSDETLIELNNGCLCCTVGGDLARTIRDLFVRRTKGELPEFERIVIETTGLADPAPILQTLIGDPMIEAYFRLDGVVTVVDGVNGRRTLELQPEAVKQVAVADRLVLSKVDLATPEAIATLRRHLRELNPAAPILEAVEGVLEPSAILNAGLYDPALKIPDVARWLQEEAYSPGSSDGGDHHHHHDHQHHHDVNRHDDRINAFCIRREAPISGTALSFFLSLLMGQRGEDLLRVKGILNVQETPETPMVIHGVQHIVHPPVSLDAWPSEDRATRLVFITRGIAQHEIEPMLDALMRPRVLDRMVDAVSSKQPSPDGGAPL